MIYDKNKKLERVKRVVDQTMGRLSLEEKIGACLTQTWRGSIITPSVIELIEKLHTGGLRIEPYTTEAAITTSYGKKIDTKEFVPPDGYFDITQTYWKAKDPGFNISAAEYAERLNKLKEIAMNRNSGIPLHICTDFEGDFSHDIPFGGINLFPANMGIRAAGGSELAYQVGHAMGTQLAAIGVNMLHSPVMDVNINPDNPEINIRAFSDDPKIFSDYAIQMMHGLEDSGIVATAKHFPGRGDSSLDAHHGLPVLDVNRQRLDDIELFPYRAAIAAGLRAVMIAHNAYPALDSADMPSSLSYKIITGLLRNELGFKGVITTDAMGMGAIVERWGVPVASAMALKAGCDLVLLKFDNELRSQSFFEIKRWVDDGRLSEQEIDEKVIRILTMKAEQGLFETGGIVNPENANSAMWDKKTEALAHDVARQCISVLRDRDGILPLSKESKALVVEQRIIPEFVPNNEHHHIHSFSEAVLMHSMNIINMDTDFCASADEEALLFSLLEKVDVVIITNYYWRIQPDNNSALIKKILQKGKKVIVVTNNPYPMGTTNEACSVICTYSCTPESLNAAAELIFGKIKSAGSWPLENMTMKKGKCL